MNKRITIIITIYALFLSGCAILEREEEFDISSLPPTAAGPANTAIAVITSSKDDAEEDPNGNIYFNSSDLELSTDLGKEQVIGLRFKLDVPKGVKITEATIQFTADEVTKGASSLQFFTEASDDATPFETSPKNISGRPTTSSSVSWAPADWTVLNAAGEEQQTPSLVSITQEVISRTGWQGGNHIVYIIRGSGTRTAESFDGVASAAPRLTVAYTFEEEVVAPPSGDVMSVTSQVSSATDDAEEDSRGNVYIKSSDIELTTDLGADQVIGLRFKLDVPNGVQIEDASIQFTVDETSSGPTDLSIYAEASDNSATYSELKNGISGRPKTSSSVEWSPAPWNIIGDSSEDQLTPSLKSVVQEVTSRDGWVSGNYISFIVFGSGNRVAEAYDGGAKDAPILNVSYSLPPEAEPEYGYNVEAYDLELRPTYNLAYRDGFLSKDEDADGLPDSWELAYGLDPTDPTDAFNEELDHDGDFLIAREEFLIGSSPIDDDSDGDGIPDGFEVVYGLNAVDSSDALGDLDGDGYSNLAEYFLGTEPNSETSAPVMAPTEPTLHKIELRWTIPSEREDGQKLASGEIRGYIIYFGASAANPDSKITIDDPATQSYVIEDLEPGTYYFSASTIDSNGVESKRSPVVERTVP